MHIHMSSESRASGNGRPDIRKILLGGAPDVAATWNSTEKFHRKFIRQARIRVVRFPPCF